MAYSLSINGSQHSIDADGDTPLLWVLRDLLDMKGTKFGCGMAFCGACTVHLDGDATRSCQIQLASIGNSKIVTIEAVGDSAVGQKIQQAWIRHDVPQCGYCQAGQIMTATALLAANPNPTDAQINDAMDGNLCRCGSYPRIHAAIKAAAGASL